MLAEIALRLVFTIVFLFQSVAGQGDPAIVRGVLFYSPTCPHCHQVIREGLPPILEKYGERLLIIGVDVSTAQGNALFQAAGDRFSIPREGRGVPMLVVGETVLVGSVEIPARLPEIVESDLAAGGVNWPQIPGLREAVEANGLAWEPDEPVWLANFKSDLAANLLAVVILAGMLFSAVWVAVAFLRPAPKMAGSWPNCSIPLLALLGLGIAAYLSYVEITRSQAFCGPLGDCNAVQASPYARLFGVIPIGVLGLGGYAALLLAWAVTTFGRQASRRLAAMAGWGLAFAGTLFSVYLTALEPFVIGASCAWCLASAVLMTLLLWAFSRPALEMVAGEA